MASPRPPSAVKSSAPAAGTDEPPSSVTATRATPSRGYATDTMNAPPSPEAVCLMAFAHSSDTQVMSTSLAGQPTSSSATKRRASGTDAGVPQNVRIHGPRVRVDPTEPAASADPKEPTWSTG